VIGQWAKKSHFSPSSGNIFYTVHESREQRDASASWLWLEAAIAMAVHRAGFRCNIPACHYHCPYGCSFNLLKPTQPTTNSNSNQNQNQSKAETETG
jgi:hypothetical protein